MKEIKINYFLDEDGRKDDIAKGGQGKELKSHKLPLNEAILFHSSQRISGCGTPALINLSDTTEYSVIKRENIPFTGLKTELVKSLNEEQKNLNLKIINAHNHGKILDFFIDDYFSKSTVKKFKKVLSDEELYYLAAESLNELEERKINKEKVEEKVKTLNLEILENFFRLNEDKINTL